MRDMTKEEFLKEVAEFMINYTGGYGVRKHDTAKVRAVLYAIDCVLERNIVNFPDVGGIRLTDMLRLEIRSKPARNYKAPAGSALQTCPPRNVAKLRTSQRLRDALTRRQLMVK